MNDKSFRDVAPRYADWETHEQHLAELRRELEEEREVTGIIARERQELRNEIAELRQDKAGLAMRLSHALDREQLLTKRLRRNDWRGTLLLLWWQLTGRA